MLALWNGDVQQLQRAERGVFLTWAMLFTTGACYALSVGFFAACASLRVVSIVAGLTTVGWVVSHRWTFFLSDRLTANATLAGGNLGFMIGALVCFHDWAIVTYQSSYGRRLAFAARPMLCLFVYFTGLAVALSRPFGQHVLEEDTTGLWIGACAGIVAYVMSLVVRLSVNEHPTQGKEKESSFFETNWKVLLAYATVGGAIGWVAKHVSSVSNPIRGFGDGVGFGIVAFFITTFLYAESWAASMLLDRSPAGRFHSLSEKLHKVLIPTLGSLGVRRAYPLAQTSPFSVLRQSFIIISSLLCLIVLASVGAVHRQAGDWMTAVVFFLGTGAGTVVMGLLCPRWFTQGKPFDGTSRG
jgi:hypothetical protein